MTEQSNAELIAEARELWEVEDFYPDQMIPRLVKALEAADQRAAELAAVVESIEPHLGGPFTASDGYTSVAVADGRAIRAILASAPADALREVKAAAWFEGADAAVHGYDFPDASDIQNPYRTEQS